MPEITQEFDGPWKEALDLFLRPFLEFAFPSVAAAIDWLRGYEVLDKELEQLAHEGELSRRLADKLFKVWRKDGQETWVLIHIEVQAQPDSQFAERMYIYHYRIYDRYRRPVVSLAVLGDEQPNWRPSEFSYTLWGCTMLLRFPMLKLLDYAHDLARLEQHPNVFGLIVLAHLQSQATRTDAQQRYAWKIRLVKNLLDRGLSAETIRLLFKLIDWLLALPAELAVQFEQQIYDYEKEKQMPYITSIEQRALARGWEEGRQEGREEGQRMELLTQLAIGLKHKFGTAGEQLLPALQHVQELDRLRSVLQTLWLATTLDEIRGLLPEAPTES